MYEVRYYQDYSGRYLLVATCATLEEARDLRMLSGDLVVEAATDRVVSNPCWLWNWERLDPSSYAARNLGEHRPGTLYHRSTASLPAVSACP